MFDPYLYNKLLTFLLGTLKQSVASSISDPDVTSLIITSLIMTGPLLSWIYHDSPPSTD